MSVTTLNATFEGFVITETTIGKTIEICIRTNAFDGANGSVTTGFAEVFGGAGFAIRGTRLTTAIGAEPKAGFADVTKRRVGVRALRAMRVFEKTRRRGDADAVFHRVVAAAATRADARDAVRAIRRAQRATRPVVRQIAATTNSTTLLVRRVAIRA